MKNTDKGIYNIERKTNANKILIIKDADPRYINKTPITVKQLSMK